MTRTGAPLFDVRPPRHPALDGARGLAVVAMVLGHTLDALLSTEARAHPWVQHYWALRGVTAPLFLLVSGWAVVALLGPNARMEADTLGRRVRRALLLLFLGYLLKWPGWEAVRALGWSPALFDNLLVFDALQCIGLSLLMGACTLAVTRNPWLRALLLGALAAGIPLASAAVWHLTDGLPGFLQQALGTQGARFPLFPWAGFFFAGALAAHLLRLLWPGWPQGLALGLLGLALLSLTRVLPADWSPQSAWMVAYRVGQGLLVLAAVNLAPAALSRLLAPMGRVSLWVYVLHLPVVYGWAGIAGLASRVEPKLDVVPALGMGVALLSACTAVAWLGRWLRRGPPSSWRPQGLSPGPRLGSSPRQ